jgi:hypothetical protein
MALSAVKDTISRIPSGVIVTSLTVLAARKPLARLSKFAFDPAKASSFGASASTSRAGTVYCAAALPASSTRRKIHRYTLLGYVPAVPDC